MEGTWGPQAYGACVPLDSPNEESRPADLKLMASGEMTSEANPRTPITHVIVRHRNLNLTMAVSPILVGATAFTLFAVAPEDVCETIPRYRDI